MMQTMRSELDQTIAFYVAMGFRPSAHAIASYKTIAEDLAHSS